MTETEGVIKYRLDFARTGPPVRSAELTAIDHARTTLHDLGLVGQTPERYGGYGFGNVSIRWAEHGFLISGTQTGGPRVLGNAGYAVVSYCDPANNQVIARGAVKPSSEALTHGTVYALDPKIQCVLHAHSPVIWLARRALGLPSTRGEVPYGTPAMAAEVARLYTETDLADTGVFSMDGHEDGVVAFGCDTQQATERLVACLARTQ